MTTVQLAPNQRSNSHQPPHLLEISARFDPITRMAARVFNVSTALIVCLDADRQEVVSWYGRPEVAGDFAFCGDLILKAANQDLVSIPDLQLDPQLAGHPLVTGQPTLRFYAGVPLSTESRGRIGALCILDNQPRSFTAADEQALRDLAVWATAEIEQHSRDSEPDYRTVINALAEGVLLQTWDNTIAACNASAARIMGVTTEQIVGRKLTEMGWYGVHEDGSPFPVETYPTIITLQTGQTQHDVVMGIHKSDSSLLWILVNSMPLFHSGETRPYAVVTSFIDISQSKATETILRRQALTFETISDAVIITNLDRTILDWNPGAERMFGYTKDEVIGQPILITYGNDITSEPVELRETLARRESWAAELPFVRKDGSRGLRETVIVPLLDQEGKAIAFIGVNRDITERKRVETDLAIARDQALESSRLKSEFLANMSHEIRTPMTGVIGMADLLKQSNLDDDQRKMAEVIRSSSDALLSIINDILDFSKIEAGKLALESLDFILPEVIEGTLDLLVGQARIKGLPILTSIDENIPQYLLGDPMRLRQILLNLLSNAIKFTEQGKITLQVSLDSNTAVDAVVRFNVIDTGIGLTDEDKSRLFKAFSQADGSTTRRYGGSGLGLAICQRLVEMMDGEIGVESEPDQGSTFWFTVRLKHASAVNADEIATMRGLLARAVPNREISEAALTTQVQRRDTVKSVAKPRILLVEDNVINQELACLHLERLGYAAEAVGTGEEALQILSKKAYALVLMDCMMPGMDGLETTRQIRKKEAETGRHVPIVALTANAMQSDRVNCLEAGMDDYLAKPIDFRRLLQMIQHWTAEYPVAGSMQVVASEPKAAAAIPSTAYATLDAKTFNNLRKLYNQSDSRFMGRSIGSFLDNSSTMLKALRDAVERNDLNEIYRLAHTLKSSSASYGAVRFSGLCKILESEARAGTFTDLFQQLERLETEYEKVTLALKAEQDKESQ